MRRKFSSVKTGSCRALYVETQHRLTFAIMQTFITRVLMLMPIRGCTNKSLELKNLFAQIQIAKPFPQIVNPFPRRQIHSPRLSIGFFKFPMRFHQVVSAFHETVNVFSQTTNPFFLIVNSCTRVTNLLQTVTHVLRVSLLNQQYVHMNL